MSKSNDRELDMEAIISLEDNDGNVIDFEHVMTFASGEGFYVALAPVEATDEIGEDEVVLMRLIEDEEGDLFEAIESEEELDSVWADFEKQYYEED